VVKRPLFNFAAVLSLLLCVAATVLWVRSYMVATAFGYYSERLKDGMYHDYYVYSAHGQIAFTVFRQDSPSTELRDRFLGTWASPLQTSNRPDAWRFLGFRLERVVHLPMRDWTTWGVPYGFLFALTITMPAIWIIHRRRHRYRANAGLCPRCGYDLRATPDRCPECGTFRSCGADRGP
jgi:hypothetical protein